MSENLSHNPGYSNHEAAAGDEAIKVRSISKKFCKNLRRSMGYGIADLTKNLVGIKPDSTQLRRDEFWALDDVSFELKKGEILGIIGVNGSGKSTLLSVLSGIFPPDKGEVIIRGQVGSLIAIGAGIHPHMTGRENIYLNGTILGMSKEEINEMFDEIVQFSEIGDFLEAPVATYSSGMKVRLGFGVAIHRVPEVLLVDEVLAVGDIAFKKKCMNKMEEIKRQSSIIFISHNMLQIERICNRVILLHKGKIMCEGEPEEIISQYYNLTIAEELSKGSSVKVLNTTGDIQDLYLSVMNSQGEVQDSFCNQADVMITCTFESRQEIMNPIIGFGIENSEGIKIANIQNIHFSENPVQQIMRGKNSIAIIVKHIPLLNGVYRITLNWKEASGAKLIEAIGPKFAIISNEKIYRHKGIVKIEAEWKKKSAVEQVSP